MPYNKRPGVVEKNVDTLEQIKQAADRGQSISYTDHPARLAKTRDRLHWILGCAKVFTGECNGRYASLRDRVKVSVDWGHRRVSVIPIQTARHDRPSVALIDERDTLVAISEAKDSDSSIFYFTPSTDYEGHEWFASKGDHLGLVLDVHDSDSYLVEQGLPPVTCIVTRKPKRSAFDIIKR